MMLRSTGTFCSGAMLIRSGSMMSTTCARSSSLSKVTTKVVEAGGRCMSAMPILVTMPRLDWVNMPSGNGPKPYGKSCHELLPGTAPMPVRMTSPVGSTTSMPVCHMKWSPYGV